MLPSLVNSIQAMILGCSGWFCLLVMVRSWSGHALLVRPHVTCICLERSNIGHMLYCPGAQMDSFISGPVLKVFYSCNSHQSLRQLCLLCVQHLRALCLVGRSQVTLSELMQTHVIHVTKGPKAGFSAKAQGYCWASIAAAVLLVASTRHGINSHMPEQCWADVPKGTMYI